VYHKYKPDPSTYASTWVLVGQTQRTEVVLDRYLEGNEAVKEAHPFELHVIFLDIAIASWREYLAFLFEKETILVKPFQS
jgi:hypothetical protein